MRIHYDPNGTSQTLHIGDIAMANIQGKMKNLYQQSRYIGVHQFEVRVRKEAY